MQKHRRCMYHGSCEHMMKDKLEGSRAASRQVMTGAHVPHARVRKSVGITSEAARLIMCCSSASICSSTSASHQRWVQVTGTQSEKSRLVITCCFLVFQAPQRLACTSLTSPRRLPGCLKPTSAVFTFKVTF